MIGFAIISLLFQQDELNTLDKTRSISEIQEQIQETITYLKSNPKDGRALKSLGALYKEAGLYKEAFQLIFQRRASFLEIGKFKGRLLI